MWERVGVGAGRTTTIRRRGGARVAVLDGGQAGAADVAPRQAVTHKDAGAGSTMSTLNGIQPTSTMPPRVLLQQP